MYKGKGYTFREDNCQNCFVFFLKRCLLQRKGFVLSVSNFFPSRFDLFIQKELAWCSRKQNEPVQIKPTIRLVRLAKTQISLCIHTVSSEFR